MAKLTRGEKLEYLYAHGIEIHPKEGKGGDEYTQRIYGAAKKDIDAGKQVSQRDVARYRRGISKETGEVSREHKPKIEYVSKTVTVEHTSKKGKKYKTEMTVQPQFSVGNKDKRRQAPSLGDVADLLDTVLAKHGPKTGTLSLVITGVPKDDSPTTKAHRHWKPGDVLTLSRTVETNTLRDIFADPEVKTALDFVNALPWDIKWIRIDQVNVLDKG